MLYVVLTFLHTFILIPNVMVNRCFQILWPILWIFILVNFAKFNILEIYRMTEILAVLNNYTKQDPSSENNNSSAS